jgi:hypothetical protein
MIIYIHEYIIDNVYSRLVFNMRIFVLELKLGLG